LMADFIQGVHYKRPLKVLFDTGSDKTFIKRQSLPKGATPSLSSKAINVSTLTGNQEVKATVKLQGVTLPEFSTSTKIDKSIQAYVFDHESTYDVILGNDVLIPLGFNFLSSSKTMQWMGSTVEYKPLTYFEDAQVGGFVNEAYCFAWESSIEKSIDEHFPCCFATTKIKESKYEIVPTEQIIQEQKHLNEHQRSMLFKILEKFQPLFNGNLIEQGQLPKFKGPKVSLELLPNSKPVQSRPFPVPHKHHTVFKHELDRLEAIDVLSRTGPQEWLAPTFIIPKKDGRVRWISDFRALNKCHQAQGIQLTKNPRHPQEAQRISILYEDRHFNAILYIRIG